jgi:hypothetical protein
VNEAVQAIIDFLLEDDPVRRERAAYVARLRKRKVPYSKIGKTMHVSRQRAHQLYRSFNEAEDDIDPKELASPSSPDEAIQRISQFMNEKGLRGEFKLWPKGTYRGPYPEYAQNADFSLTLSGVLADEWEENFRLQDEFDLVLKSLGYHMEMGTRSSAHFYLNPPLEASELGEPAPEREPLPPPNLQDIQF